MSRISKLPQIITKHNQKTQQQHQSVSSSPSLVTSTTTSISDSNRITTEFIYFCNQNAATHAKSNTKIANLIVPSKSYEKFIIRSNKLNNNKQSSESIANTNSTHTTSSRTPTTSTTTATTTTTTSGVHLTGGKSNSSVNDSNDYDYYDGYYNESGTDEACYNDTYSNDASTSFTTIDDDDDLHEPSESELTDITPISPTTRNAENKLKKMLLNESSTPMMQHHKMDFSSFPPQSDIVELIHFANGKIEETYPNGTKKIKYKNGTIKYIYANNTTSTTSSSYDSSSNDTSCVKPLSPLATCTSTTTKNDLQSPVSSYSSIFNKYDDVLRSTIKFENGDLVDLYESGTEIYLLRQQDLIIEKHVDKREIYRYLDSGLIEIKHPNGFIEMIHTSDMKEFQFAYSQSATTTST